MLFNQKYPGIVMSVIDNYVSIKWEYGFEDEDDVDCDTYSYVIEDFDTVPQIGDKVTAHFQITVKDA